MSFFLLIQAKSDGSVVADFPSDRKWAANDSSVFVMSIVTEEEWKAIRGGDNGKDEDFQCIDPIRAVNLGGWLVADGRINPSLFDGIPNKDLLVIVMLCLCSLMFFMTQ